MIKETGRYNKYYIKENSKAFLYPQEWIKMMGLAKPKQEISLNILINTGARYNEAKHIKVEDIDFVRNNLILKVTKVRAKKKETKPTPRILPISSKFAKQLKKYIRIYKLESEDYFPMLQPAQLGVAIKNLARKVGRKDYRDFSPHNIRKTFECWLVALDISFIKIVKHLGHTMTVASNDYISSDIFNNQDRHEIRVILGDLYDTQERRY